jgi:hypothetical protein
MSMPKVSGKWKEWRGSISSVTSRGSERRHRKRHDHSPSAEKHHGGRSISPSSMNIYRKMKDGHSSSSCYRYSSMKKKEKKHKRDRDRKLKSPTGQVGVQILLVGEGGKVKLGIILETLLSMVWEKKMLVV